MEVCPGMELIAIEASATVCDRAFQIGEGLKAQMTCHMRHGSPARLMAPELIRGPASRGSDATRSAGNRMRGHASDRELAMSKRSITVYPTYGHRDAADSTSWIVQVRVWVHK